MSKPNLQYTEGLFLNPHKSISKNYKTLFHNNIFFAKPEPCFQVSPSGNLLTSTLTVVSHFLSLIGVLNKTKPWLLTDIPMIYMVIRSVLYWNCFKDEKLWIFAGTSMVCYPLSRTLLFSKHGKWSVLICWACVNSLLSLSLVFKLAHLEIYFYPRCC